MVPLRGHEGHRGDMAAAFHAGWNSVLVQLGALRELVPWMPLIQRRGAGAQGHRRTRERGPRRVTTGEGELEGS